VVTSGDKANRGTSTKNKPGAKQERKKQEECQGLLEDELGKGKKKTKKIRKSLGVV